MSSPSRLSITYSGRGLFSSQVCVSFFLSDLLSRLFHCFYYFYFIFQKNTPPPQKKIEQVAVSKASFIKFNLFSTEASDAH